MNFKKLPLFLVSAILLSSFTISCESEKPSTPAPAPAPKAPKTESSTDTAVNQVQTEASTTDDAAEE